MSVDELLRGRYRVLHLLGTGSSGPVYKAVQESTQQIVAVKLLALDASDGEARERRRQRFLREIALCSQLYHPDIVRLVDSGQLENGMNFAAFEYIPGVTLAQVLSEQGALTVRRTCQLMSQLLDPLAYAHRRGILHRDLKPGNIMVTGDGLRDRIKVLDFGIGIATGQTQPEQRLTLTHEWVGTAAYAAPEQLRGDSSTPRSDLYAWGLMFLECLTGRSVVTGRSLAEVVQRHLISDAHEMPPALRDHRLGAFLARVLEKNPSRRPSDAATLMSVLETIALDDLEDGQGFLRESAGDVPRHPAQHSDTVTDGRRPETHERRHATVVCCRLVPSAQPATSIESVDILLEDTSSLIRELMSQFGAGPVHSFGEYSIAYFGLSRARDADAQLALRAALAAVERVEQTSKAPMYGEQSMRVRVGIHNGPVTVQLREGSRRQVDGVTAGLAMRLASLDAGVSADEPSTILVSADFRALVDRHASLVEQPALAVQPPWQQSTLAVYRAERGAHHAGSRTQKVFVGREKELKQLRSAWEASRQGPVGAVLIWGEPGVGKSALTTELRRQIGAEADDWVEVRCLPEWSSASLRPMEAVVMQLLGISGGADSGGQIERGLKELGLSTSEGVPLICGWLSLPLPAGYQPLTWSPQKQRQMLHELVADLLREHTRGGRAVVVEDLHWADPSTLECVGMFAARAGAGPAFLLMTSRLGASYTWSIPPAELVLEALDTDAVERLIAALVPQLSDDRSSLTRVVQRCDGIPLYVEALAMSLNAPAAYISLATGTSSGAALPGATTIPASLRDLLAGHLDDLGETRGLAEFAAALGREFLLEHLQRVSDSDDFALLGEIEQLVSAGILVHRPSPGGASYAFRHALIRDAAYEAMPERSRQRAHEQIAEGFEARLPKLSEGQPDVLAYHWENAGDVERAVTYWQAAARKSAMTSAHLEALDQIDRGLALTSRLPVELRRSREAELLLARGANLVAKRGYTEPDAVQNFERVAALIPPDGEPRDLAFAARWGLWYAHNAQANMPRARQLAAELEDIAGRSKDTSLAVSACEASCETGFCEGKFEASISAARRCAALYDLDQHRHLAFVRGDDPLLASLSFEAMAEQIQGRLELARVREFEALELAERLGYPGLTSGIHGQLAWIHLVRGGSGAEQPDMQQARRYAEVARNVAHEHGFPFWELYAMLIGAAARIIEGDLTAVPELSHGADMWKGAGAGLGRDWHLTFIADGLRRSGKHQEALATLDEALRFCDDTQLGYFRPEIMRQRALVLLDRSNPRHDVDAGLEACRAATAHAANQQATWWELAARVSYLRADGPSEPATDLRRDLAGVLGRIAGPGEAIPPLVRETRNILGH